MTTSSTYLDGLQLIGLKWYNHTSCCMVVAIYSNFYREVATIADHRWLTDIKGADGQFMGICFAGGIMGPLPGHPCPDWPGGCGPT